MRGVSKSISNEVEELLQNERRRLFAQPHRDLLFRSDSLRLYQYFNVELIDMKILFDGSVISAPH